MTGGPLEIGSRVRVLPPWSGEDEASAETTIEAVQYIAPSGEIVDEPQERWQYLLDGEEPFASMAFLPEYIEAV